jgi:23S rRNA (cytidine1920-2'-O)/16S rRNA (cytidine1409-2'-O)-methyltransferase
MAALLERTNLGDSFLMTLDPLPTILALDLSYLSLTPALPLAATILAPTREVLAVSLQMRAPTK